MKLEIKRYKGFHSPLIFLPKKEFENIKYVYVYKEKQPEVKDIMEILKKR